MIITYNLSPTLENLLPKSDNLRIKLLTTPLAPKTELRLKWEAKVSKVYWSLTLSENKLSRNRMAKLLSTFASTKYKNEELEVINYKRALNYLENEWTASPRMLTVNSLQTIYNIACKQTERSTKIIRSKKKQLNGLFEYLHTSTEHPIIQAGISQIAIIEIAPFENGNGRIARLLPYLYLYKHGYGCRELLVIEEFLRRDLVGLNQAVDSVRKNNNLTVWLEFFVNGIYTQLESAYENTVKLKFTTDLSRLFWKLNNRQMEILNILDVPGAKITNKMVQDKFKVSQITASRDLAKLFNLDLVFVHGKGRSTYYTKA